jgi:hypothetical protein
VNRLDTPPIGAVVRRLDRLDGFTATVTDVFMGSGGFAAMILEWEQDGKKRVQSCTCRDWRDSWEVIKHERRSKRNT